jgi:hypothetical protein
LIVSQSDPDFFICCLARSDNGDCGSTNTARGRALCIYESHRHRAAQASALRQLKYTTAAVI